MKFVFAAFVFLLLNALPACQTVAEKSNVRPNILFFLVDDQRNDVLGCAGHPIVQTPVIDRLAAGGIRFENAFVTTSICAASRASILTGLYESRHGYTFGTDPVSLPHVEASYPFLLREAGYRTGFIGKFGIQIADQAASLTKMFDYYAPSPQSTPHFVEQSDGSRKHSAEIKGDQAIAFLRSQPEGQPFCLSVSFNAVHAVDGNLTPGQEGHYPYPESARHLYEETRIPPPKLSDPAIFDAHPVFMKESMNRDRFYWRWDTEEKYQINIKAYFRMISGYDAVMGRVLEELESLNLSEQTVILYSADNGYYMGNRGFAGKWSHYEESLRVPLIMYDPRVPERQRGRMVEEIVLNIDLPATMLDLAGIAVPELYQGASLLPLYHNKVRDWRTFFFCEHRLDNPRIPKWIGIRGERYVYARYYEQDPVFEYLHDLQTDPDQLENLAQNPDYGDVLNDMRKLTDLTEEQIK